MAYRLFINATNLAKGIMNYYVKTGYKVLDCTVGNGNDTLELAQLVGDSGMVYGFDIQDIAISITRAKLKDMNLENRVKLIRDSHEKIDKYIAEGLDFVIYNLGYLPGGNKAIKTMANTTLLSIQKALRTLNKGGILLITCYSGHEGGITEKKAIENFLEKLDQKQYNALKFCFINQANNPPLLLGVEKY